MKEIIYNTQGTCSKAIRILIDEHDIVQSVEFLGGCAGNTVGISSLVKGMPAAMVIERLKGITCGMKSTSCPDQLATALSKAINNK